MTTPASRLPDGPSPAPTPVDWRKGPAVRAAIAVAAPTILVAVGLVIGLYKVDSSGPLWPDAPRYANAAAMIRDWLASGEWLSPYRFAQANYAQYPAFNIPFHPPVYPGLMALAFLAAGTSYGVARAFVAASLGLSACVFYAIQRRFSVGRLAAVFTAVLLMTTPEIARQGRDTMSEVPALAVILTASYLFLGYLDSGRPRECWAAFGVAALAFLCRVTTAGNLPGWFLFALVAGRGCRLRSPHLIAAAFLYLIVAGGYVKFSSQFAQYEVAADGKSEGLSWANLSYFAAMAPVIGIWGTSIAGMVGLACTIGPGRRSPVGRFWLSWLLGYTAFKLAMPTSVESRHFFGALPGFAGLAACLLGRGAPGIIARGLGAAVVALGLSLNILNLASMPCGVVGYQSVAECLAAQDQPANVLLSCPHDQELIFRYRAQAPRSRRMLIRGDRTLAIRLSEYARVAPKLLAHRPEDVLDVVRRGRIRYVVTTERGDTRLDTRTEEMVLAHQTINSRPESFRLIARYPVRVQFEGAGSLQCVCVWAYLGDLPDGPSELPIIVPTAGLILGRGSNAN